MKILLDTCTFVWAMDETEQLPESVVGLLNDPANELYLSAVSVWEVAVKCGLGKLTLPEPLDVVLAKASTNLQLMPLPLCAEAATRALKLPPLHKDPFDRMLICQARHHNLAILTPDQAVHQYGVPCLW
jgi:PIN domain nuclease of toxin-antitoxin system